MKENTCGCGCGCEEEEVDAVDTCGCGDDCDCDDDCDCGDDCSCGDEGGCGCGHDHAHGPQMITLTMDDDTDLNCIVLGVFEFGGSEFMALLPENDDQRVFFYHYTEEADGGINLENIESEDEFNAVAAHFMTLIEEQE